MLTTTGVSGLIPLVKCAASFYGGVVLTVVLALPDLPNR
jgi:hypothetical protein